MWPLLWQARCGTSGRSAAGTSANGATPSASATVLAPVSSPSSVVTVNPPSGRGRTRTTVRGSTAGTAFRANHSPYAVKNPTGSGTPCSARIPRVAAYAARRYAPAGSDRSEAHGSDFSSMPAGMSRQERISCPWTRTDRPRAAAWAATDRP
ncbi:hypothetical protein BG846_05236 [Streptomyces fradiae ATCC 10745 = DSM 40063]|uniref:Uncharacterized protein n=1 Tax=Streptomyces fradiae ATCC 10745 = DSM 40063 TaxID=1319510 RepID=A0A1Y2NNN0_STRFR|nr:hypothetical protein BG846_05236 [Streptomyces fradiae ATCC 10745 = DSM 40063]